MTYAIAQGKLFRFGVSNSIFVKIAVNFSPAKLDLSQLFISVIKCNNGWFYKAASRLTVCRSPATGYYYYSTATLYNSHLTLLFSEHPITCTRMKNNCAKREMPALAARSPRERVTYQRLILFGKFTSKWSNSNQNERIQVKMGDLKSKCAISNQN